MVHDSMRDYLSTVPFPSLGEGPFVNNEVTNQLKWDHRFLILARHVSTWSHDPSTKCGAVVVRPDRTISSLGYNGFPRKVADAPELYENRPEKYSRMVHAEMNAILSSPERPVGFTLYSWPLPTCDRCAAHIIQSGISRVVWAELSDEASDRWQEATDRACEMYAQAGVRVSVVRLPDR